MAASRQDLPPSPAKRVKVAAVEQETGLSARIIQMMAARGDIPGAAKLGGTWTFDVAKLRRWIREQEAKTWQGASTSAGRSGGGASVSPVESIVEACERALGLRPNGG